MTKMADERNFRSQYYEKVGFRNVEEKKSIEILLKEQPLDLKKLNQFCLRFTVPSAYRILVWKVLLGILPAYQCTHEVVSQHRTEEYNDVQRALRVMNKMDTTTALPEVFVKMWHVERGMLLFKEERMESVVIQLKGCITLRESMIPFILVTSDTSHNFMSIASSFLELTDDHVEAYWLTKSFLKHMQQFKSQINLLPCKTEAFLQKEDSDVRLYAHLQKLDAFSHIPLLHWFTSCFAHVLPLASFQRIWDKIIGGSCKILVFVAVAILLTFKRPLLSMKSTKDINQYLSKIPEDSADIIVVKALDLWQKYGNITEPSVSRGESPVIIERPPS